jgi:hypothetical protein
MRALPILLSFVFLIMLAACSSKKKPSLSGEDPVEVEDFLAFFPELKPTYQMEDTFLLRADVDSLRISKKVFTQFVPDSVQQQLLGKKANPKFYPIGRIQAQDQYLLVKAVSGGSRTALLLAFNKKNEFIAAMNFLVPDKGGNTRQYSIFGRKEEISLHISRKNAEGNFDEGREVYVLNSAAGDFTLILTDALDKKPKELINPIDTLSRKMKYTADYGSGKTTIFSFRDGRKSDRLNFFIHFEKNNGDCIGELKGEAVLKAPNKAEYREPGEPCALTFTFSAKSVTVKELEPCGSRRGLRCSFDGVYTRKPEPKPKPSGSKKKK